MATFALQSIDENSATFLIAGMSSGVATLNFYIAESSDSINTYIESRGSSNFDYNSDDDTYEYEYVFTGLDSDTEYRFTVAFYNSSGTRIDMIQVVESTIAEDGRPTNWSWTSTVKAGAAMDYTKISDTEYKVYPLTASEWNGFVDRVVAFAEYSGMSIPSNYGSSWYATRGTEMTAEKVNYMHALIGYLPITVSLPAAASSNRGITAAFINGLKNSLNSIE